MKKIKKEKVKKVEKISLNIDKLENFYSNFSNDVTKMVNPGIVQYIDNSAKKYSIKSDLDIHIDIKDTTSKKKCNQCVKALKNYYHNDIKDLKYEIHTSDIIALILFGVAIAFLVIMQLLININCPFIIKTAIEVATWVFMWETVDIFCLKRTLKTLRLKKLLRIYNAKFTIV